MPRHHPCLAPLPAPLGLRFRALLGLGFVPPPGPGPAPTAPPSPTRCSRLPASLYVATEQIQNRRPGRCHREVPPASPPSRASLPSRPPRAAARVPLSRCVGLGAMAGKNRTACIPFSSNARKRTPSWQLPPEMHAFRDQDGNILALCIPFPGAIGRFRIHGARILPPRALFRVEEPEITHGAKMLPAPPGLSATAACGPAGRALRPAAQAWPACRMRPPCHLACARRGLRSGRTGFAPCSRASPSETRHAVPVPMHLATCAPHPSRQPRAPTASRKQAEQHKQLNAGIKIGSPNGDPIEELFGFAQRLPDALQSLHQANELALSYLDHSTRQRLGGYVIGLSGNSFTVDLYAALVDHATSIAR